MNNRTYNVVELPANLSLTGNPVITYVSTLFPVSSNHILHASGLSQIDAIKKVKDLKITNPVS